LVSGEAQSHPRRIPSSTWHWTSGKIIFLLNRWFTTIHSAFCVQPFSAHPKTKHAEKRCKSKFLVLNWINVHTCNLFERYIFCNCLKVWPSGNLTAIFRTQFIWTWTLKAKHDSKSRVLIGKTSLAFCHKSIDLYTFRISLLSFTRAQ
jgi:hypothetical protein